MALKINSSVTVFASKNKTGYVIYAEDVAEFKKFVAAIPEGDMVFMSPKRAETPDSVGRIEISHFTPRPKATGEEAQPKTAADAAAVQAIDETVGTQAAPEDNSAQV